MAAKSKGTELWGGAVVPYEINPDLANIGTIRSAIRRFEQQTNLRFVGRLFQEDFVRFSKQTKGKANSDLGRVGGKQFLNASSDNPGTLLHEIAHAVGLMHEHQRDDRKDFIVFHPDRLPAGADKSQYEIIETAQKTATYDFRSITHYRVGDPANPVFESVTGVPPPGAIGRVDFLTTEDLEFMRSLYPAPPVIRRSSGDDGAGGVQQTSALAVAGVNAPAILVTPVVDAGNNYHVVLWEVGRNGNITRLDDPSGAVGGDASHVHMIAVGPIFLAAMKDASNRLCLISHGRDFERLKDSRSGKIRALKAVALELPRVAVACISSSGRLKLIIFLLRPDGSIVRLLDSGDNGPAAESVAALALPSAQGSQLIAVLSRTPSGRLVLSLWRVDSERVERVADSGEQIGKGDLGEVVATPSGHVVVVCRDASSRLTLIPFAVDGGGTGVTRIESAEARAGKIREVASIARPYGVLTSVINASGNVFLIKWSVDADGRIVRLGDSGDQAGKASRLSIAALPFPDRATACTAVRNASGDLVPISWDDSDGPGELSGP